MRALQMLGTMWQDLDTKRRLWFGYVMIVILAVAVGWSMLAAKVQELEKKRAGREAVLREFMPLKVQYMSVRQSSDQLSGRMASLRPDDSPARIIEDIGIKGKGIKTAPLKGEERGGLIEEAADIRVDALTLNEAINLLYRLEKGSRPVIIKKSNLKARFDDPSRFDLALNIALLRPAPGQAK